MKMYYVYILSSSRGTLYTGVTNNIWNRLLTHKRKDLNGFTRKYSINRLIFYEEYRYINIAIAREKEIKGWRRSKKLALIRSFNPEFTDLSQDWLVLKRRSEIKDLPFFWQVLTYTDEETRGLMWPTNKQSDGHQNWSNQVDDHILSHSRDQIFGILCMG